MTVTRELDNWYDLENMVWGQAKRILEEVAEHDLEEEFMDFLEEVFVDSVDEVALNDYISYEWEEIYDAIGLSNEEEEEED